MCQAGTSLVFRLFFTFYYYLLLLFVGRFWLVRVFVLFKCIIFTILFGWLVKVVEPKLFLQYYLVGESICTFTNIVILVGESSRAQICVRPVALLCFVFINPGRTSSFLESP